MEHYSQMFAAMGWTRVPHWEPPKAMDLCRRICHLLGDILRKNLDNKTLYSPRQDHKNHLLLRNPKVPTMEPEMAKQTVSCWACR